MKWLKLYILISIVFSIAPYLSYAQGTVKNNNRSMSKAPLLISPTIKSFVQTLIPEFKWRKIDNENIEYRLLIAESNGKIIIDKWVGNRNSYKITDPTILKDLSVYHWNVHASSPKGFTKSENGSFYIDLNVSSDLGVYDLELITEKPEYNPKDVIKLKVNVKNCGPTQCFNTKVMLYRGNSNINYLRQNAFVKSQKIDSVTVKELNTLKSEEVILTGNLIEGYNHFFATVGTNQGFLDFYLHNNSTAGPVIQTIKNKLELKALYVIYPQYLDADNNSHTISNDQLSKIYQDIIDVQNYFWDHTHITDIKVDTLHIQRVLTNDNFESVDQSWGYALGPWEIENDLKQKGIQKNEYDLIYAFYSWNNSFETWSGYRGYTYKTIFDQSAFAAQPITSGIISIKPIVIHEILHIFEHFYEQNNNENFISPDNKKSLTSFVSDMEYYTWILETWPSIEWFNMNRGQTLVLPRESNLNTLALPQSIALHQNYPNPFNNSTLISYQIPSGNHYNSGIRISLEIYNLLGECVRHLVDSQQQPGVYSVRWNGMYDSGTIAPSGIYFYKLNIGHISLTKKLLLIR